MPRNHLGFLILTVLTAASLLTATAACPAGGASPAVPVRPRCDPAPAQPPKPIDVLSASFVSPSMGWLLAELPCDHPVNPCRSTVLMRETVNSGRTGFAVPAPPALPADMYQSIPPSRGVGRVWFTSARDGWVSGPSLWRTTDSGETWRRVPVPGRVSDFTVVGGRMFAVIGGCGSGGNCAYRGYTAAVGAGTWRPVPGTAITGTAITGTAITGTAGSSVQLAVSGSVGYLLAVAGGLGKPVLLTGPVTGSARWRSLPVPCAGGDSGALAAAGGWLFLGCGGEPGAGNQLKHGYLTRDGGRKWHLVASPPLGGYLGSAIHEPGRDGLPVGRADGRVHLRDRGGSWRVSPGLAPPRARPAGFPLLAMTVTGTFGVVIQQGVCDQAGMAHQRRRGHVDVRHGALTSWRLSCFPRNAKRAHSGRPAGRNRLILLARQPVGVLRRFITRGDTAAEQP